VWPQVGTVFHACCFSAIEPTDNTEGGVRDHATLDLARGFARRQPGSCRASDPARADVQEDLFDWAPAIARGVAIQLVENEEVQRLASSHLFLVFEQAFDDNARHEAFGAVAQRVNVDHGDLIGFEVDPMLKTVARPPSP